MTPKKWLGRCLFRETYSEHRVCHSGTRKLHKQFTVDFILGSASHFKNMLTTEDKACKHKVEVTVQHYKAECNNRACKHKHTHTKSPVTPTQTFQLLTSLPGVDTTNSNYY